jgi:hypothetical protein
MQACFGLPKGTLLC